MIEAQNLTKIYGKFAAIQDVSFSIPKGEVVAFIGPNGAGKTTTMRILSGYLAPTSGTVKICGLEIDKSKLEISRLLGYLPENGPLYEDMTPREILAFLGEARGLSPLKVQERIDVVYELCSLEGLMDKPVYKLSKGNRQRVGMAQALLHEPEVLIMDKTTSGLDPNQIVAVRNTLREFGQDKTILISTHILQEVEAIADRVIFINEGRIVFDGSFEKVHQIGNNLEEFFCQLTQE